MTTTEKKSERRCVTCGKDPPDTHTAYTLIGEKFGWRLSRHKNEAGEPVVEWRCGDCWRKYKNDRGASGPSSQHSGHFPAVTPPRSGPKDE